ncbi:helix-turn-helix domain-containing protein [Oerskovia sp. NPDC057915]|uniref:helix-turn-helix domain-containing protein n=1 Tax=Oerskovia sp. NPDC057915 TaxID=3346280 RepID=UPI0036DAB2FC
MTARFEWERALLKSTLPSQARLVALTLATSADPDMTIPERFSPSLTTLAERTGLSRSSVAKYLNTLEREGWVTRDRPTVAAARTRHERTGYGMHLPLGAPEHGASAPDGLGVREADQASAPDGLDLVRATDQASAPDGLNHLSPSPSSTGAKSPRFPRQCQRHQDSEDVPPCTACQRTRKAQEAAEAEVRAAGEENRGRHEQGLNAAIRDGECCEHDVVAGHIPLLATGEPRCRRCRAKARRAVS